MLIYHQSYTFARSSTAVSLRTFPEQLSLIIDPAVYYAHLAGNRARVRDERWDFDDDAGSVASLGGMPAVIPLKPMHHKMNEGRAMWFV
jgi:hypothetical protein